MERRYGTTLRNSVHNIFNNRQVNVILSSIFIASTGYICVSFYTGRCSVIPFKATSPFNGLKATSLDDLKDSAFALMLILFISLAFAKLADLLLLPRCFGSLIAGFVLINAPTVLNHPNIPISVHNLFLELAIAVFVIRWGLAFDVVYFCRTVVSNVFLGAVCPFIEAIAIALLVHFGFDVPLRISILCSTVLTAATFEIALPLFNSLFIHYNVDTKQVSQVHNASCSLSIVLSLIATTLIVLPSDEFAQASLILLGKTMFGVIVALLVGWLLWWFPRGAEHHTVIFRSLLLGFSTAATISGCALNGCLLTGILASFVAVATASGRWSHEQMEQVASIELVYERLWEWLLAPLVFAVFAMNAPLSQITTPIAAAAISVVTLALIVRFISTFVLSFALGLSCKEQFIVAVANLSKGSIQALIVPLIFFSLSPMYLAATTDEKIFVVLTCAIGIIISAPIVHLAIIFFAPRFLDYPQEEVVRVEEHFNTAINGTYTSTLKIDDLEAPGAPHTYQYFKSTQINRF